MAQGESVCKRYPEECTTGCETVCEHGGAVLMGGGREARGEVDPFGWLSEVPTFDGVGEVVFKRATRTEGAVNV